MRNAIAIAILCILCAPAFAEPRVDLSVGVAHRSVGDDLDSIADARSLWMVSLGAGLHVLSLGELRLHAEAAFQAGGREGRTFQTIETDLSVKRLLAGARADLALHPRVRAFGRAMLGTEWADLELTSIGNVSDRAWAATSTASAGVEALLIRVPGRRYTVTARVEAAYTQTTALSFRAGADDDELAIDMAGADLGSLELSGAGVQAALALQF